MKRLVVFVTVWFAGASAAAQDDPLKTARDLYASAAYEEALSELLRVGGTASTPAASRDVGAYRTFCLVALGRTEEAESVAESLIRQDPMRSPEEYPDASPRIAAMFGRVRTRVLPQLIRDEYGAARALAVAHSPEAE